MEIAVSFLKSKFNLKDTINKINDTNADYIHVDVMDGIFVPSISFGMPIVSCVRPRTGMFMARNISLIIGTDLRISSGVISRCAL